MESEAPTVSLNSMPVEDMEYSIASQIAYDYYDTDGDVDSTQQVLDNYIEGYTLDPEVSNENASTIVRPDGSAILAFRGTRFNVSDINADASIVAGEHHVLNIPAPRFVEADTTYNLVKNKYNNVDLTGHSLGGTLADYIARTYSENAVIFNPGETPLAHSVIEGRSRNTRMYLTNSFDLVSFANPMYSSASQIFTIPQTTGSGYMDSWLNSHSLRNFLPTDEMSPISYIIRPTQSPQRSIPVQIFEEETPPSVINIKKDTQFTPRQKKVTFTTLEYDICQQNPFLPECKDVKCKLFPEMCPKVK